MKTLLIAAATALFGAAVITELTARLWPDSYLALLLLAMVVIFCCGLLNLRLARIGVPADAGRRQPGNNRRQQGGGEGGRKPRDSRQRREGRGEGEGRRRGGADRQSRGNGREPAPGRQRAPDDSVPAGPRETGTVKWFNRSKGFGFIIRESGEEIFVHQRSIRSEDSADGPRRPNLKDGQRVAFSVSDREKGKQADDVTIAENGAEDSRAEDSGTAGSRTDDSGGTAGGRGSDG